MSETMKENLTKTTNKKSTIQKLVQAKTEITSVRKLLEGIKINKKQRWMTQEIIQLMEGRTEENIKAEMKVNMIRHILQKIKNAKVN